MEWPKVSIVIPTLNAANVLPLCLNAISKQDYPKDKVEIIIPDGGSRDDTRNIGKKHGAKIVENELKTGESGKAVGVGYASGEFVALIDSDNILPDQNWLKEMLSPLLKHRDAVGSEPWEYTWRKSDGFIARYSALTGVNDPLALFLGNYDRMNYLTQKWTEVPHEEVDHGSYLEVTLDQRGLPTIGANGTVFRTQFLAENISGDYLFDIDILANHIKKNGSVKFIKVKNGIIHTFCESSISKFARKQRRRVKDYLYHQHEAKDRQFNWEEMDIFGKDNSGLIKFILYCLTIIPLLAQSIKGYVKKPDLAWFFHPLACEITLWEYGWGRIFGMFKKSEISRDKWGQ